MCVRTVYNLERGSAGAVLGQTVLTHRRSGPLLSQYSFQFVSLSSTCGAELVCDLPLCHSLVSLGTVCMGARRGRMCAVLTTGTRLNKRDPCQGKAPPCLFSFVLLLVSLGYVIYRVRVHHGGRKCQCAKGQTYGKPKTHRHTSKGIVRLSITNAHVCMSSITTFNPVIHLAYL